MELLTFISIFIFGFVSYQVVSPPKTFETSDLYLASALKTNGFKLVDTRKGINGRGIFVFEDRPDRPTFVKNYFNGELRGSLKAFANAWSDLKTSLNELD